MPRWPQCDPRGSEPSVCQVTADLVFFQEMPGITANGHSQPVGGALTKGCGLGGRTRLLNVIDYPPTPLCPCE